MQPEVQPQDDPHDRVPAARQDRVCTRARARLPRYQARKLSARAQGLKGVQHHPPHRLRPGHLLQGPAHKQAHPV